MQGRALGGEAHEAISYVICTTVRSGSWMLCSALTQTGVAGRPAEYFGQTLWEEIMNNRDVGRLEDVRDFMKRVIEVSTTENGVFGTKLPANHAGMFLRRASEGAGHPFSSLRDALETSFPKLRYVLLTRANKVAQAISLYRAIMTGHWRAKSGDVPESVNTVEYDPFAIQRCYQDIVLSDAYWDGFFTAHGMSPIILTYEDLARDYGKTVRHVLAGLDLPSQREIPSPQTARLSDKKSAEWETRFRAEKNLPPPEPPLAPATFWAPF